MVNIVILSSTSLMTQTKIFHLLNHQFVCDQHYIVLENPKIILHIDKLHHAQFFFGNSSLSSKPSDIPCTFSTIQGFICYKVLLNIMKPMRVFTHQIQALAIIYQVTASVSCSAIWSTYVRCTSYKASVRHNVHGGISSFRRLSVYRILPQKDLDAVI